MNNPKEILLGVNIDHIATIRQSRGTRYPEPVQAALLAEQAGADSITVHLREDRRHIQQRDINLLSETIQTRINLEMAVTDEMLSIAEELAPCDCCLVPEQRQELTTEGGLDVIANNARIEQACIRLKQVGTRVSLFIDTDRDQIKAAADVGAPVIEIHTGHYANAKNKLEQKNELGKIIAAVNLGVELGLEVNAGHGLHYHNTRPIAAINEICELNIGHAIISNALFVGLQPAVSAMKKLMVEARLTGW